MKKNTTRLLCLCLLLTLGSLCQAQPCSYFPADCPSDQQLPDSSERFGNPVLPAEVSMDIRLRHLLERLMQAQAEKKRWQVYEYDESAGSGYLNADRSGPLAAPLRPPHSYEISFVFIVNADSLSSWQTWEKNYLDHLQEELQKLGSGSDYSAFAKMQDMRKIREQAFRNASMIRVKFEFNPEDARTSTIGDGLRKTKTLSVPHAVLAIQAHNDKTDEKAIFELNQFARCNDLAFVLFGNWNLTPDSYQIYRPVYEADKKNTDFVTPKRTASHSVRTIELHVEGSPAYTDQFLESLDVNALNGILIW